MKAKITLFVIFVFFLVAAGLTTTIIFNTAPTSFDVISLFYLSLFILLWAAVFYVCYIARYLRFLVPPTFSEMTAYLRLSAVTSLVSISFLLLLSNNALNSASAVILIISGIILELILRRRLQVEPKRR